jgi:hypothetical protein
MLVNIVIIFSSMKEEGEEVTPVKEMSYIIIYVL